MVCAEDKSELPYTKAIRQWTAKQRVQAAKENTERLINRVDEIVQLQEIVRIVAYTDALAKQIPYSRAAHAFKASVSAMHHFLLIRVVGLWDKPDYGQFGVPTIAALINNDKVLDELRDATFAGYDSIVGCIYNPADDPDLRRVEQEALQQAQRDFANKQADKVAVELSALRKEIFRIRDDALTVSVRNVRHHLSHGVVETTRDLQGKATQVMKFGDEDKILSKPLRWQKSYISLFAARITTSTLPRGRYSGRGRRNFG